MGNRSSVFILGEDTQANNLVSLWKVSKDQPLLALSDHTSSVSCVRFSPDDKQALSSAINGSIIFWDLNQSKSLRSFHGHHREVSHLAMDTSTLFSSGGFDTKVKLWDIRQKNCVVTYRRHEHDITSLHWAPNGKFILSGDSSGHVKLWDVAAAKPL